MRQDRNQYSPKPRPRGNQAPDHRNSGPPQHRSFRPAPPPRPKRPAQPAFIKPHEPASGKQRRQMLKAAAWRLAAILRKRPSAVMTADPLALESLVEQATKNELRSERGDAMRLAAKIQRLRK